MSKSVSNNLVLGFLLAVAQPGVRAELRQNAGEARSTLRSGAG